MPLFFVARVRRGDQGARPAAAETAATGTAAGTTKARCCGRRKREEIVFFSSSSLFSALSSTTKRIASKKKERKNKKKVFLHFLAVALTPANPLPAKPLAVVVVRARASQPRTPALPQHEHSVPPLQPRPRRRVGHDVREAPRRVLRLAAVEAQGNEPAPPCEPSKQLAIRRSHELRRHGNGAQGRPSGPAVVSGQLRHDVGQQAGAAEEAGAGECVHARGDRDAPLFFLFRGCDEREREETRRER